MPMRTMARSITAIILAATSAAAADNPLARFATLSPSDCVDASNMIAEDARAPFNATALRVQHIGDPGTAELTGEIANVVTWDVGAMTGLHLPPSAQRGYRDVGLPVGASAFQLACDAAGFLINTWQFSHASPLFGEGPSASVSRDLSPAPAPFRDAGSAFLIEARVSVPWAYTETPPTFEGTAQVSFFYYALDTTTGTLIGHVIALFDNRPPGVGGSGVESLSNDGVVAFADSPLVRIDATGAPVRYVTVSAASATMRFVQPWAEGTFFRAEITYANFRAMLLALKGTQLPAISADPLDYRVPIFGLLGEVFPGTASDHNVSLGASVSGLTLLQSSSRSRRGGNISP
jgi:hypothetical protein